MEPMTLGSAPSSPATPTANPNFLPAFLMGDASLPNSPNPNISPGRNRTPSMRKLGASTPDSRNFQQKLYSQAAIDSPIITKTPTYTTQKSGPPKQGLFDTIEQKKKSSPILNSTAINYTDSPGFSKNFSRINQEDTLNNSSSSRRNLNDTINSNRIDRIDTNWVTVFGFPPSGLSLVMAQLANCGTIVEKKIPAQGNWAHVKFSNLNEVARALALNGRCINNCMMIGVNLFYNKENKENDSITFTSPTRARSLRQSFISPNQSNTVIPSTTVPQKSTGLVSKAIEYVFGW